jgi:hypothetical protein
MAIASRDERHGEIHRVGEFKVSLQRGHSFVNEVDTKQSIEISSVKKARTEPNQLARSAKTQQDEEETSQVRPMSILGRGRALSDGIDKARYEGESQRETVGAMNAMGCAHMTA